MQYPAKTIKRNFEIDWKRFPSVVFESDDWGACEVIPTQDKLEKIHALFTKHDKGAFSSSSTLERPEELEVLYRTLENASGADGLAAVFTAFVCVSNPDYNAIRKNEFTAYEHLGLDKGVPGLWQRGDIAGKWREGFFRGIFAPEYHGMLHHTSTVKWLERLNSENYDGELACALFGMQCYYQGEHVPEYEGLDVREQNAYTKTGIESFKNIFGFTPDAAVTSDAYPETETVWSINGIKTVCLKNCRLENGKIEIYRTKLWNNQDESVRIGEYDPVKDVVYMTRNVFFERGAEPESTFELIRECIDKYDEPAIVSSHRNKYANLDPAFTEKGIFDLEVLLSILARNNFYFLSTAEISSLYRHGWSMRHSPEQGWIIRKWHEKADAIKIPSGLKKIVRLPLADDSSTVELVIDKYGMTNDVPFGTWLLPEFVKK